MSLSNITHLPLQVEDRSEILDQCGVLAVLSRDNAQFFSPLVSAFGRLQTRGYDGAGMVAVSSDGQRTQVRGTGTITQVFGDQALALAGLSRRALDAVLARLWVFHTRYGTSGTVTTQNFQPLWAHHTSGDVAVVVHNGQFLETTSQRESTLSDTHAFAQRLSVALGDDWDARVVKTLQAEKGAFALAIATGTGHSMQDPALYITRDAFGIRPLVYGWSEQMGWVVASETVALQELGIEKCVQVVPGQILRLNASSNQPILVGTLLPEKHFAVCSFEFVYIQDGTSFMPQLATDTSTTGLQHLQTKTVYDFRVQCGQRLAEREMQHPQGLRQEDIDVVIGIPGTGIAGGMGFANALGVSYIQAISDRVPDNQRTFMTPEMDVILDKKIMRSVERTEAKFVFQEVNIRDKRVVVVDDSMVRGGVSLGLVWLLKHTYGARKVHFRVVSPIVDDACHLGINTRRKQELLAERCGGDVISMCRYLQADSLRFLEPEDLSELLLGSRDGVGVCMGCFKRGRHPILPTGKKQLVPLQKKKRIPKKLPVGQTYEDVQLAVL